jgi:hypothetical protein
MGVTPISLLLTKSKQTQVFGAKNADWTPLDRQRAKP